MTGQLDPKGRLTVFKYDALGRERVKYMPFEAATPPITAAEVYDALNAAMAGTNPPAAEYWDYDESGRLERHTDYMKQDTGYVYNDLGQLWQKQYYEYADTNPADGQNDNYPDTPAEVIEYTYDALGRQDEITKDGVLQQKFHYDNEGRVHVIDAPQGVIEYLYNPVTGGKTAVVTYAAGTLYEDIVNDTATPENSTTYGYDDLGRLDNVNDSVSYGYNAVGSRDYIEIDTDVTTGWELRTSYTYNSLNRLTALVNEKTGPTVLSSFDYTLAADGMRTGVDEYVNENRHLDYECDNLNRLIHEYSDNYTDYNVGDPTTPGDLRGYKTDYTYDLVGNRNSRQVTVRRDNGSGGAETQTLCTSYKYDLNTDRLIRETNSGSPCAVIPYGDNQRIYAYAGTPGGGITYQMPGSDTRIGQFKAFWLGLPSMFNSVLFYILMVLVPVAFFWPVFVWQWSRIRGSIDPLASPDLKLWHRMLCVLLAYTFLVGPEAFHYYAQGAAQYGDLSTAAWGDDGDVFSYCYDANGSQEYKFYGNVDVENATPPELIANHSAVAYDHYLYNLQNRLARVEKYDTSHTLIDVVVYRYNPQGIRISKDDNGVVTDYLIDPYNHTGYAQVLQETTDDGATLSRIHYTIGDDVISQTTSTSGDGINWTAEDLNTDGIPDTEYLFYDGHGSTRQLPRPDQSVIDSYNYDAYGVMLSSGSGATAASNAATRLLYSGEQYDGALDQYYLRARYYNPANGLFTKVDPYYGSLRDPQSLHKYLYCHANPMNNIDPSGEMTLAEVSVSVKNYTINMSIRIKTAIAAGGAAIGRFWNELGRFAENVARQVFSLFPRLNVDLGRSRVLNNFIDFTIRTTNKVAQIEVKYRLPQLGNAYDRLVSQINSMVVAGEGQSVVWTLKEPTVAQLNNLQQTIGIETFNQVQFVHGVEGLYQWITLYFGF